MIQYTIHIFIFICFYTILSQSLNLSAGLTGLVSLAHAGFYGIGAYTTAILSVRFGFPFWFNLPLAIFISGAIAFIVSAVALRTVDDYFVICTLGIQIILFTIMNNLIGLTRGPLGIYGIPPISFLNFKLDDKIPFLVLSLFFTATIWIALSNISKSGFGKILNSISTDEIYTQSIGKNIYQSKLISFTFSAALAAIPGALYAHYISYIDPTSFTIDESIFILSIVIIGGFGDLRGSLIATVCLVSLPEILRFIGIPEGVAANARQIIYGIILIISIILGNNILNPFHWLKLLQRNSYPKNN